MLNRYIKFINKKIFQKYLDCFDQSESKKMNISLLMVIFGAYLVVISVGMGLIIGVWLWPGPSAGGGGGDDLKQGLVNIIEGEQAIVDQITKTMKVRWYCPVMLPLIVFPEIGGLEVLWRDYGEFDLASDRVITTSKIIEDQLCQNKLFEEAKPLFLKSNRLLLFSLFCGTAAMIPVILSSLVEGSTLCA
jgi:hypothetical protein